MANFTSPKLHVLTLTPFFPSDGDEARGCFVAEALRVLTAQGVVSSVIAVDSFYHPRRTASKRSPAEWIRYPQLPGNFGLSSAGRFLGALLLPKVRETHRHSPIHVIHAHAALPCGDAAAFLSRRLKIPFVVTVHGLDVFNVCFEEGIAAGWRRRASRKVYESAARVICISQKVQRALAEGSGADISSEVVYNGTDVELFTPGAEKNLQPTILAVGTLLAGKGQELVVRAIARLKDSHPALQCQFIGEGADQSRFAALANRLEIGSRVHFAGRRTRAQVAEAMQNCTLFVLPSRYEGLGCVYLEAMACGKVAVGCRGQGIDEIIQDGINGKLIPIDGLEELVQALDSLLGDSNRRDQIGQAARQTIVSGLTLEHQAARLRNLYEEVAR